MAEALILPAGLVTAAYLGRRLGADGYGLFTIAAMLVSWFTLTMGAALSETSIKLISEADDWRPASSLVLRAYLVVGITLALLLLAGARPISEFLGQPRLAAYMALFAVELVLQAMAYAHRNVLIGRELYRQQSLGSAIRAPVRLALIIVFVESGLGVGGAVLASVGTAFVEFAVYRYRARPTLFARYERPLRSVWRLGVPLFINAIAMRLFAGVDLFALSALGGSAAQVGYYGAAQNLSVVPSLFAVSFAPLLLSTLSRFKARGRLDYARPLARDALRVVWWMVPFAAMTAGAADDIALLVYGSEFEATGPLLARLIFSGIGLVMMLVAASILIAGDRPRWTAYLSAPLFFLALAAHRLVIPVWGPEGAANVTTALATLGACASMAAVYGLWKVAPPLATIVRVTLLSVGAYLAAIAWHTNGWVVVLKLIALLVLIPLGLWATGEIGPRERRLLRLVRRSRSRRVQTS